MRPFWPALAVLLIAAVPCAAQQKSSQPEGGGWQTERSQMRMERLNALYKRLAEAADEQEAKGIILQIERLNVSSGSPSADLIMDRATLLLRSNDLPLASEMVEKVLILVPQWPEAWYRRAILFHLSGDTERATIACLKTLSLEPRHLQALEMLGALYSGDGNEKNALYIYRKALALHPSSSDFREVTRRLTLIVEGREL